MRFLIASFAAIAVQPLILAVRMAPDYFASPDPIYGTGWLMLAVLVVAGVIVLLAGIPTYLVLRRVECTSWTSLTIAGAVLGALPAALFWPRKLEGYSSGHNWHGKYVDIYVNGIPTTHAWISWGENLLYYGIHGGLGALVFHATIRILSRPLNIVEQE